MLGADDGRDQGEEEVFHILETKSWAETNATTASQLDSKMSGGWAVAVASGDMPVLNAWGGRRSCSW